MSKCVNIYYKLCSHIPTTCPQLQLTLFDALFPWILAHPQWISNILKMPQNANRIDVIFKNSICEYGIVGKNKLSYHAWHLQMMFT